MFSLTHFLHKPHAQGTVRPYCPNTDKDQVAPLIHTHLDRLTSVDRLEPLELAAQRVQNDLAHHTSVVYEENGKCLGFICFGKDYKRPVGHIHYLAVDTTSQKGGIGSRLMEVALESLHRQSVDYVRVQVTAGSLRKYYRKFGFRTVCIAPRAYDLIALRPDIPFKRRLWSHMDVQRAIHAQFLPCYIYSALFWYFLGSD